VLIFSKNVSDFFDDLLTDLECQADTRAYIVSIFGQYKSSANDLSQHSIGERYCQARENSNFAIYQQLGDWLFFTATIAPQHLHHASQDYYHNIARLSYYSCYRLINREWRLFEEMADRLPVLEEQVKQRLPKLG
jgi:hypothetical protein